MLETDPISQFFSGQEDVDLYSVLGVESTASSEDIRKSYRRHALLHHPDKHASSSEYVRSEASVKFQQIGFAYSVLGDEKRRQKYDRTGSTDEGLDLQAGEDGWDAYFADLFEQVTKSKLDELKKEYQGSSEEIEDLKKAYRETDCSIGEIMSHIPLSTNEDEGRFVRTINQMIRKGELPKSKTWEASVKDEKAKLVRKKASEKEAAEAEELAKELGIWEEFYGDDKFKKRSKGLSKGRKGVDDNNEEEGDDSALQALILKRQKERGGIFDRLAAKYTDQEENCSTKSKKGKKRKSDDLNGKNDVEIDDATFAKLQEQLFEKRNPKEEAGTNTIDRKKRRK